MLTSLSDAKRGQRCRIETLAGSSEFVQRLMEFGILEGEEVTMIGFAPLGDPLELQVGQTRLSLRRAEAAEIQVTVLSS